jgi:hypothetical protein
VEGGLLFFLVHLGISWLFTIKCFLFYAVPFVLIDNMKCTRFGAGLQLLVDCTRQQVLLFVCKFWRALSFPASVLLCYFFHPFGKTIIVGQIRWDKSPWTTLLVAQLHISWALVFTSRLVPLLLLWTSFIHTFSVIWILFDQQPSTFIAPSNINPSCVLIQSWLDLTHTR